MSQDVRVLVGDDDVNDRVLVGWAFKKWCPHIRVDFARSGEEVIRYLEDKSHPPPTLVIVDSMMPKADGFAVVTWMRTRKDLEQTPVVMWSGQVQEKNAARARGLGVKEYVSKPHDSDDLAGLIENWKQSYLTPPTSAVAVENRIVVGDVNASFRESMERAILEVCPDAKLSFGDNPVEVLEYFADTSKALPSLVLLDLGASSLDVLKLLRDEKRLVKLPVIVWSGVPVGIEEELAIQFKATAYLKKPNTFDELLAMFRSIAGRYFNPDTNRSESTDTQQFFKSLESL